MDKLRISMVLACFVFFLGFSLSQAETQVTPNGVKFPDGTTQTTAASGGGTASFPRPAYDSGWQSTVAAPVTLNHNLGGDTDNYLIDLQFKYAGEGSPYIHNEGIGGDIYEYLGSNRVTGAYWRDLTNTQIVVQEPQNTSGSITHIRIRIWTY